MMTRALDPDGDWTFGAGLNDYLSQEDALLQDITTRLKSFLGDCFFDITAGVDWFNLLGGKSKLALELAISAVIINTENVLKLTELSVSVDSLRNITITYSVKSVFPGFVRANIGLILTEDGDVIVTEGGVPLHA